MEADFQGWATKAGIRCSDGRTIMPGAFKHQDKLQLPLVWQHGHNDPTNVLGHIKLEHRDEGVYAYGFFNKTDKAKHTAEALDHGDLDSMSIWANELEEAHGRVTHGTLREVSLVLSGANPGAKIESVTIRHSDGEIETVDDEAIIFSGEPIQHDDGEPPAPKEDDETLEDIVNSMDDKQKTALEYIVEQAVEAAKAEHSNLNDEGEENKVRHNVFENDEKKDEKVLSHSQIKEVLDAAIKDGVGSFKAVVDELGAKHGIENIEVLFPEATQLTAAPEFLTRRMEWVQSVINGARKTPFSRVKTATADLTWEDARAKGYIKGNMKKEEFYGTSRRETTPTTIYKKQKLDRDDIIDITDFDVVAWMKGEMRIMLDEEIARSLLIGDGRSGADEDKIREDKIRPIIYDDDFYTIKLTVNPLDAGWSYKDIIRTVVRSRSQYRGTGTPTMYTTEAVIAEFLLLEEADSGQPLFRSLDEVAARLRVDRIVPVEVLENHPDGCLAIIVNMNDYVIGADRGGQVAMFDDFDIDFNQYKYLIETRISGALVRPKSAMVIFSTVTDLTLATPAEPTFNAGTGVVTIPVDATADYQTEDGLVLSDGAQPALAPGERIEIHAKPTAGNYFPSSETYVWRFLRPAT